jgi:putative FmdB family regulatory protein
MPLYEYKCQSCGKVFEVMQRFSDEPLSIHEGCGGAVERLLSPPAFQFKGSGWYITDYARKADGKGDSKPARDGESQSGSPSASCCGSKSESDGK